MSEPAENTSPGTTRRTILRASAWSLPVVAVALGTPLAAASTPIFDIIVFSGPEGSEIGATSPDGLQAFTLQLPSQFDVLVEDRGERVMLPPGATVQVSFDTRLLGDLVLEIFNNGPAQPISSDVQGSVQTVTFILPFEFDKVLLLPSFGIVRDGEWVPDANPYTVIVMSPPGVDEPNLGNNSLTIFPTYAPTTP
ncbi:MULTISPECIES: hypothetical protein [unclassified Microbacterium]|uniref:hypothetical protein n=1 Tax=unclassified Microbacterium TaxID=2609290 RepID=UPI00109CA9A2|nr:MULTISPECIES: hypothetical protein [unclassified Microbacterium]